MNRSHNYFLVLLLLIPLYSLTITSIWNGQLVSNIFQDENILITGNTTLNSGITAVTAANMDIMMTFSSDAFINSNDNVDQQSILVLEALAPYTITIQIEGNIEFGGVENYLAVPLIISEEGNGNIRWVVKDNAQLIFGSTDTRGGTHLSIYFNNSTTPNHTFEVHGNGRIKFKRHSKIGFRINSDLANYGYAIFDAINPDIDHSTLIEYADGATIIGYKRRPSAT